MQQNTSVFYKLAKILLWGGILILCSSWHVAAKVASDESISARFNQPGIVKLYGYSAKHTIKISVPQRWRIKNAKLTLSYINSTALMKKRSRLIIAINENPIHQVDLFPKSPEGEIIINIPGSLLKKDYNDLTIAATQNFTDTNCIPLDAPEVWTALRLYESAIDITYALNEVPLSLASVSDFLFDPKMDDDNSLHLVVKDLSPESIEMAVLAASGAALRFAYRPMDITLGHNKIKENTDNIIIGTHDFINGLLESYNAPKVDDNIGIRHLPIRKEIMKNGKEKTIFAQDATHALIYLSGTDQNSVKKAAQAFSLLSHPLPAGQTSKVDEVILPQITRYSGDNVLAPEKEYEFKELGWRTTTFSGYNPSPAFLTFNLPSDVLLESNRNFTLFINLSYAAVMREDSSLSIMANDIFVSSIALNNITGGQYRNYRIELPLSNLKPGLNTIEFKPVLTPLHTGDCEYLQTEHLALTIFENSRFTMPEISHWTAMPRLDFLFEDGFPLAAYPDFKTAHLVLPDKSKESALAAINIISMLSQKTKIPPIGLKISNDLPLDNDSELLVIGSLNSIPENILNASPLFPKIEQPFWGRLPGTIREKSGWDKFKESFLPVSSVFEPVDTDVSQLNMEMLAGPGKMLIHEFESPNTPMRSVVMVTADSSTDIEKGAVALWDRAVQYQCRAGAAILDLKRDPIVVKSYKTHDAYYTGKIGSVSLISYFVNSAPRTFFIALACAFIILAGLITYTLKRRLAKKQNQTSQTE